MSEKVCNFPAEKYKKRFCWFLGAWAIFMVLVSQVIFWGEMWGKNFAQLQKDVQVFWLFGTLVYIALINSAKEAGALKDTNQKGEVYAFIVMFNFPMMAIVNILRNFFLGMAPVDYPDGVLEASIEAGMLLAFSYAWKSRLQKSRLQRENNNKSNCEKNLSHIDPCGDEGESEVLESYKK